MAARRVVVQVMTAPWDEWRRAAPLYRCRRTIAIAIANAEQHELHRRWTRRRNATLDAAAETASMTLLNEVRPAAWVQVSGWIAAGREVRHIGDPPGIGESIR